MGVDEFLNDCFISYINTEKEIVIKFMANTFIDAF